MRKICRTPLFRRDLRSLARKHRDLPDRVTAALAKYAADGVLSGDRLRGLGDRPVFKDRLSLRGTGKRGGARILVYCDERFVIALRVYTKAGTEVLPGGEIRKALKEAGLGEVPSEAPEFELKPPR